VHVEYADAGPTPKRRHNHTLSQADILTRPTTTRRPDKTGMAVPSQFHALHDAPCTLPPLEALSVTQFSYPRRFVAPVPTRLSLTQTIPHHFAEAHYPGSVTDQN